MRAGAAADDALAARRNARRVCSAREIARALQRMADAITADLAGADPVVLAVMHGGAFAAVEICRRLRFPYELDFVHVTRYARGTHGGEIEWRVRPSAELTGRTVLVVDDVYLFGCGMDYRGYWRGLPALYALASAKPRPAKKRARLPRGRTRM